MKGLFKVAYTYKSYKTSYYDGSKTKKETYMFLDYCTETKKPSYVPTNRLSGFERATIEILEAEFIRDVYAIEITDFDIERNELMLMIELDNFLYEKLNHDENFESIIIELAESQYEGCIESALEHYGYKQRIHDNTYNYCSDLENDIDFKVYTRDDNSDYLYDSNAIVYIDEHYGLDARCGYGFKGIYKALDYDGICSFICGIHVNISVNDNNNNEIDYYDGDGAVYNCLKDYQLVSMDDNQLITVKNNDGEMFTLSFWN